MTNGVKEFVASKKEEGNEENISLTDFLAEVSLATDQDTQDSAEERVTLMTVHAAKGLEFSNVFIVGVEEELFPSAMSCSTQSEIEEERRLLYVAITRAKSFCMISYASSRFRNGQTVTCSPSRFIRDINPQFLQLSAGSNLNNRQAVNPLGNYRSSFNSRSFSSLRQSSFGHSNTENITATSTTNNAQKANSSSINGIHSVSELSTGMTIEHSRFGTGVIINVDNKSADARIVVKFNNVGEKTLLLKFAKFNIIG